MADPCAWLQAQDMTHCGSLHQTCPTQQLGPLQMHGKEKSLPES